MTREWVVSITVKEKGDAGFEALDTYVLNEESGKPVTTDEKARLHEACMLVAALFHRIATERLKP